MAQVPMIDPGTVAEVRRLARAVLDQHWRDGYTVPNAEVYPWQWLWDSCFASVVWASFDEPDRAIRELWSVFASQGTDGFVPHLDYKRGPYPHTSLWGRPTASSITQPPMYGHALAQLHRRGVPLPGGLIDRARRGLSHLLDRPRTPGGLVPVFHPWETGCDDSPRWDGWCPPAWSADAWYTRKGDLVASLSFEDTGDPLSSGPLANRGFTVGSVAFNSLVAFNLVELAVVTGNEALRAESADLARRIDDRWDSALTTWVDDAGDGQPTESCGAPTLEALLPLLVSSRSDAVDAARAALADPAHFGTRFGPAQVSVSELSFRPDTYWRGPAWPQLTYLLWIAESRSEPCGAGANRLAAGLVDGALTSGFAEYWNPDTGGGLGAIPQSWTALAAVVAQAEMRLRSG